MSQMSAASSQNKHTDLATTAVTRNKTTAQSTDRQLVSAEYTGVINRTCREPQTRRCFIAQVENKATVCTQLTRHLSQMIQHGLLITILTSLRHTCVFSTFPPTTSNAILETLIIYRQYLLVYLSCMTKLFRKTISFISRLINCEITYPSQP